MRKNLKSYVYSAYKYYLGLHTCKITLPIKIPKNLQHKKKTDCYKPAQVP